jgi:hypothetical protein
MRRTIVCLLIVALLAVCATALAQTAVPVDAFTKRLERILVEHYGQLPVGVCRLTVIPRANGNIRAILDCEPA